MPKNIIRRYDEIAYDKRKLRKKTAEADGFQTLDN